MVHGHPGPENLPAPHPGELIDLSVPIVSGMPVYPGDPPVSVVPALRTVTEGVNVQRLHLGSQTGTHVDAPWHIDDRLPRLDQIPLDRFTGRAVIVDARRRAARSPIGPDALPPGLRAGDVVLVATGWANHWGHPNYLAHPYLTPQTAQALIDAGIRTIGIDAPSVDPTPTATGPADTNAPDDAHPTGDSSTSGDTDPAGGDGLAGGDGPAGGDGLAAHRVLCGAGAVIVENLTRLDQLAELAGQGWEIEVFLFPLPLADADGGPVRAIARLTASR